MVLLDHQKIQILVQQVRSLQECVKKGLNLPMAVEMFPGVMNDPLDRLKLMEVKLRGATDRSQAEGEAIIADTLKEIGL